MTPYLAQLLLRLGATLSLVALIAWLVLWQVWWSPPELAPAGLMLAWILVPLVPLLPGLALGWPRAAGVWTPLIILPYFAWGMTETVANADERGWAIIATLLTMAVFALCLLFAALHRSPRKPTGK